MKTGITIPLVSLFSLFTSSSASDAPHGNAIVVNNCDNNIFVWSVSGSIGPRQTVAPGDNYTEAIHRDPASGGVTLKITETKNGLWDGSSQMIFAYSLAGDRTLYDLSAVFRSPFKGDA